MATIHDTTMTPGKLELLAAWLPSRPWYRAAGGSRPRLRKAGGFRLDDPAGEVGIEFLFTAADSTPNGVYHVPLTYRGAPLPGADDALVGTAEHGVLGTRWVYDGTRDPVLVAQLFALCQGEAVPQHQSRSDTADPSVHVSNSPLRGLCVTSFTTTDDEETTVSVLARGREDQRPVPAELRILRALTPGESDAGTGGIGILAHWTELEGVTQRGFVVRARFDELA